MNFNLYAKYAHGSQLWRKIGSFHTCEEALDEVISPASEYAHETLLKINDGDFTQIAGMIQHGIFYFSPKPWRDERGGTSYDFDFVWTGATRPSWMVCSALAVGISVKSLMEDFCEDWFAEELDGVVINYESYYEVSRLMETIEKWCSEEYRIAMIDKIQAAITLAKIARATCTTPLTDQSSHDSKYSDSTTPPFC